VYSPWIAIAPPVVASEYSSEYSGLED